jgi:hypothetical protein
MEEVKIVDKTRAVFDDVRSCTCGSDWAEEHTCPFAVEIHGDHESLCNCCEACEHECCMSI